MNRTDAWTTFEARLAESLAVLEDKQALILSHPETHYFVQFAAGAEGELRAEAVSNHYIAPRRRLDAGQELRLIELGWKAPTHAPDADELVDRRVTQLVPGLGSPHRLGHRRPGGHLDPPRGLPRARPAEPGLFRLRNRRRRAGAAGPRDRAGKEEAGRET